MFFRQNKGENKLKKWANDTVLSYEDIQSWHISSGTICYIIIIIITYKGDERWNIV